MNKEKPYIIKKVVKQYKNYNPNYGDDRMCQCGYPYYRHFDTYDNMRNVGCKYNSCYEFVEKKNKPMFAGIGSRLTPKELIPTVEEIAKTLIDKNIGLRSGGARGSDLMWEIAYKKLDGYKEIFLPFHNFNGNSSPYYEPSNDAMKMAEKYHPTWKSLSYSNRLFHARNCHQVMGYDLTSPVEFVLCWTPEGRKDGKEKGGTSQAIRIALDKNIPIFNFKNEEDIIKFKSYLMLWEEETTEHG